MAIWIKVLLRDDFLSKSKTVSNIYHVDATPAWLQNM